MVLLIREAPCPAVLLPHSALSTQYWLGAGRAVYDGRGTAAWRGGTMANLPLSIAFSLNERVQPILDGTVAPDGIDLTITTANPGEIFWRQLHGAEFDVSEMSFSELLLLTARGDLPWGGAPIFPQRHFFHSLIIVRADAGIERPADLKEKRVGVPEYVQTAALWTRGALQHEFGVAPEDMDWYMERRPELSHAGAAGFRPPPGLLVHAIPA